MAPTRGAFVGAINRAATLSDGQQVIVPSATECRRSRWERFRPAGTVSGNEAASAPVSLGTATQEQPRGDRRIGPVTAEKILEFRDQQGWLRIDRRARSDQRHRAGNHGVAPGGLTP